MFNKISFFLLVSVLFFASCTKEAIDLTENQIETTVGERSTTIEITVGKVSATEDSGELTVDFTGDFDFTDEVLEVTQYLNFEDASGNPSTLTFQVNSFTGSNGALQAVFAIGGNNLAGLSLTEVQEIIIEDFHIE